MLVGVGSLGLLLVAFASLGQGTEPVVKTLDGAVRGLDVGGVARFLGVPFAAAPIGARRWQRPAPVKPWAPAVREALQYGPDCLASKGDYIKDHTLSEDCLYLNVFVPSNGSLTADLLPVMAFLYGGSWKYGGTSFPIYDGGALARKHQVVVVTANYRLGPFGYLGSPRLAAGDARGSTGNYGSQDQRQALEWVQDNIGAFGGDRSRVMLFGESAGAGSVVNHLVMPASNGLFRVAAMESGPPSDWSAMSLAMATAEFERLATAVNCSRASDVVACLRNVSGQDVLANVHSNSSLLLDWSPVIDHVELSDQPQHLWERNQTNSVQAILLGSNTDEGTLFSEAKNVPNVAAYQQFILQRYPGQLGEKILQLYPFDKFAPGDHRGGFATSMIFGDSLMACPARRGARWMTARGIPAYLYHFEHEPEVLKLFDPNIGVPHAAEVPFVFGFDALLWSGADRYVSSTMMSYWTAFAANATPAGPGLPAWPAFTAASNSLLRINSTIAADVNYKLTACDFWDSVYEAGCQVLTCPCSCEALG